MAIFSPQTWPVPFSGRCLVVAGDRVRLRAYGVAGTPAGPVTNKALALRKQIAAVTEQILEAQALLQRLQAERSVLEAELRGYECARRRNKP